MKSKASGIDTVNLTESDVELEKVKNLHYVSENNTTITVSGSVNICIKPSRYLFGSSRLITVTQLKNVMEDVMKANEWNGNVNRVDIALDFDETIKDNYSELMLYANLWSIATQGSNKKVFRTMKGINEIGNIKVGATTNRNKLSIYDSSDKSNRNGAKTRMEFRKSEIRNTDNTVDNTIEHIRKVMDTNKNLISGLSLVETKYINELTEMYFEEIENHKVRNFTDFVTKYEQHFLTLKIFKGVYEHTGLTGQCKNWLFKFRKSRTGCLDFTKKADIKQLISTVNREMKLLLKS